jgi:hypothetical protein
LKIDALPASPREKRTRHLLKDRSGQIFEAVKRFRVKIQAQAFRYVPCMTFFGTLITTFLFIAAGALGTYSPVPMFLCILAGAAVGAILNRRERVVEQSSRGLWDSDMPVAEDHSEATAVSRLTKAA